METEPILTTLADPRGEEAALLIAALSHELNLQRGDGAAVLPASIGQPQGIFVMAWLGDRAIGCGGVHPLSRDLGEIAAMYVIPEARGLGVGRAILLHLQSRARQLCYRTLRVEAGVDAVPMLRLCDAFGFTRIDSTDRDMAVSSIYEKSLVSGSVDPISDYTISNYVA